MASTETAVVAVKGKSAIEIVERGKRARWWRRFGTKHRGFSYEDATGHPVTNEAELERIRALVIPPAWKHVRISPSARSSLQAVGIDTSERVQYIYHAQFAARQQRRKYEKIERFGEFLPALRRRTNEDINLEGFPRERVLAVIVRLINDLYFRIGSEKSVKRYRTYGVTTLRDRHLDIKRGGRLYFNFVGKHHIRHRVIHVDEELAALIADIKKIGGPKLFEYYDAEGKVHAIRPRDVNDYIKAATAPEFSAKDFRTWGGTLLAAMELAEIGPAEDEKQAKRNLIKAVERVAERLGNTPTVCRGCYIHPKVLESYQKGVTLEEFRRGIKRSISRIQPEYEPEEMALLKMFRSQTNGGNPSSSAKTR
jgi:DNA topoisomerase-1